MSRPDETKPTDAELTEDELAKHVAEPLPDREAMSLIDVSPGPPPIEEGLVGKPGPEPLAEEPPEQV
jgi:hypothetical protein